MIEALLLASLSVATPQTTSHDTAADLRRTARAAAADYEYALRRYASETFEPDDAPCEEIIGRFCFRFREHDEAPPDTVPEHPAIVASRSRTIAAHRAWLAASPEETAAAGALVRSLIEGGRSREAVAVARSHAGAAAPAPAPLLVLGLALHEAGSVVAAESAFARARGLAPPSERARLDDVSVLLEPEERRSYSGLADRDRQAYNRRFWRFSDPSLLEAGNERRSAHYARHAWAAVLERAPNVRGRRSWRADSEEVVLRYGVPVYRERVRPLPGRLHREESILEYYGHRGGAFVPGSLLTEGLAGAPEPGDRPVVERRVVRSSYTPVRLSRVGGLAVDAVRVPTGSGWVLAVSGRLAPDSSAGPPEAPRGLLAVLDTLGREVARVPAALATGVDGSVWLRAQVPVEAGSWVYRLELVDEATDRLGLAQHPVRVMAAAPPVLSDLLVAEPGGGEPEGRDALVLREPVVQADGAIRLWAEVRSLVRRGGEARYAVEWWVEPAAPPSLLARAVRWLGRRLGAGAEERAVRVRWEGASGAEPVPLSVVMDLGGLEPGLYRLGLEVRDLVTGESATAGRLIRVSPTAPPPPPAPEAWRASPGPG